jgi:curved DNA-binding protein CbpA
VTTHYELLEVARDATADEIKRAFRREIAKYHPDKVQHLGREFQEIAAVKAAELTQAYKTLSDAALRAEYDALLAEGGAGPSAAPASPAQSSPPQPPIAEPPGERSDAAPPPPGGQFTQERAGVSEFIRRAAVARFRSALQGEFGTFEEVPVAGFEITCVPKPSFWSLKLPPRVLGRIVSAVDGAALADAWSMASKMKKDTQRVRRWRPRESLRHRSLSSDGSRCWQAES